MIWRVRDLRTGMSIPAALRPPPTMAAIIHAAPTLNRAVFIAFPLVKDRLYHMPIQHSPVLRLQSCGLDRAAFPFRWVKD